ncbi:MAG: ExeM/NucH family extracellular endonuclease [Actinophytocola sp.]|uniref:ExeM/NucH family extracellular endonuclease n=1 Tax=Actinophytocola sp. TaxID=1872138 RepID=UPI001326407F|nr:ExeM/NucH family extracellular endonuclease [Actinophytocola sp.]MPZ81587.1 ExeM/NucH family extracellular endonuclease [Actinophytocola sp.]
MSSRRRVRLLQVAGALTAIATVATLSGSTAAAEEPTAPFLSEIHYDNVGTDTGEALEIEAPVGFDLSGWQLALYNGNGGAVYDTRTLSGTVPEAGVVVATYPTDGIQNGSPDGVALVRPDGTVAEFLSYEGALTGAGGPANGTAATDIGVAEASGTPVGFSLQKVDGTWQAPAQNTFGVRNGSGDPDPDPDPVGCDIAVDHTIAEVQGTGDASPLVGGQVVVEGVVTADHRTGGYNGVYVQTAGSGDRAPEAGVASDGVFVYLTSNPANHPGVAIGDQVRVRGTVSEFNGLTEISIGVKADVQICAHDAALPAPAPLSLPLDPAARESVESMSVAPVGQYTVSEVFNTNRFGEVVLAAGEAAAPIPTDLYRPGTQQALDQAAANKLGRLLLDDGSSTNLSSAGQLPPYVYPDAPLRVGDTVEAFSPTVLSFGFDEWRLQPTTPVTAQTPVTGRTTFKVTNPRTPAPEQVGGDLRLASFNVLNYFVHFGGDARGADDEAGLAKQEAKIVAAITALDADVVALEEIENSVRFEANDPQLALERLVAALNTADGAGTWDYVRSPAGLPAADQQDVITTAIIFKPGSVTPQGESRTINDESVWFNAREPIAQTFRAGAETFTVVANHLKSKSASGDPTGDNADAGDGQGAYNGDRVRQAQSLATFVAALKADSGSDDVLLLGDFNAYTHEDPVQVLYDQSYVDLNDGGEASYVFAGESGSLDHAIASPSLADRVTGVDVWQINAHESFAFQYDGSPAFYQPDPYRASDHNPLVVGLNTAADGPVDLNLLSINDFHGRLESPAAAPDGSPIGGAAQLAGLVGAQRQENPNTLLLSGGDNIGASTFISAIDQDNPTLDALNLMGLNASAVGNHEFDKGIADLTGRVTDRAQFPYLGANVYRGDDRALPAYDVQTVDGIRVGIVGVVTEQTASLVSPDGIAGITFHDPVDEAEAVAAELKDGAEANGEADVVVLLAHEGAAAENINSVADLDADPVFGEFMRASADIDVIMSGHTHQPYAFEAPIPGTDRTRPVIQAQEYGRKLGKATLSVDPTSKAVLDSSAVLLDVVGAPEDPAVAQLVADAKANADVLGQQPLGSITADITRAVTPDGTEDRGSESVLGNFIADVQLDGTSEPGRGGAQVAFMNPGGLRADLLVGTDGVITYAEAFSVQPFANDVVTKTYTGAEVKQVLEEQWQPAGASRPVLHLGVSKGFTYTYLPDNPAGQRITSMTLNGTAISPTGTYRVTVNSFLAAGGDNFFTLAGGTDRATTGDNDLTMLTDHIADNSPVTADTVFRSSVGQPGPQCTTTITGRRVGPLTVSSGLTCLDEATITGAVTVRPGASLVATGGRITGPVTAIQPDVFTLSGTTVTGPVSVAVATGAVLIEDAKITGPVTLIGNTGGIHVDTATMTGPVTLLLNGGDEPIVVAANKITGPLSCLGNQPAPGNDGRKNTVRGHASGQCATL